MRRAVVITLGQGQIWQSERKVGEAALQWKRRKRAQHCSSSLCSFSAFSFSFEGALATVLMLQGGMLLLSPAEKGRQSCTEHSCNSACSIRHSRKQGALERRLNAETGLQWLGVEACSF
jgi:hypothetical protein